MPIKVLVGLLPWQSYFLAGLVGLSITLLFSIAVMFAIQGFRKKKRNSANLDKIGLYLFLVAILAQVIGGILLGIFFLDSRFGWMVTLGVLIAFVGVYRAFKVKSSWQFVLLGIVIFLIFFGIWLIISHPIVDKVIEISPS